MSSPPAYQPLLRSRTAGPIRLSPRQGEILRAVRSGSRLVPPRHMGGMTVSIVGGKLGEELLACGKSETSLRIVKQLQSLGLVVEVMEEGRRHYVAAPSAAAKDRSLTAAA